MSEPQEVAALAKRGRELLEASKNSRAFKLRAHLSYATPSEIAAADLLQWFASNAETIISALESLQPAMPEDSAAQEIAAIADQTLDDLMVTYADTESGQDEQQALKAKT